MFIKTLPELTITDLLEREAPETRDFTVPTDAISVAINNQTDDAIRIGDEEFPATGEGLVALGSWTGVPAKLVGTLDADLLSHLLNGLLSRNDDDVQVSVTDSGLQDVFKPEARRINPAQVFEIASRVVSPDAQVVEYRQNNKGYGFEVITRPTVVEEAELVVNDISHGGLRFGHDWKAGYLPWVQPFIYRLVCTNGMEIPDATLAVSSDGNTLEDVIADLELKAEAAFGRVEADIAAFYELRSHPVSDPERLLVRMGAEQGIGDRRLRTILESLPEYMDDAGNVTQFDLVNILTNEANRETLDQSFNARRALQRAGGNIAFEHRTRCGTCQSALLS
jgi:hypothetical protein